MPAGVALAATRRHSADMRSRDEATDDVERKVLEDVEEHGLHVVHVPTDDDGPGYSFSIGLWHNFDQPEVMVFGLPPEVAGELLNAIADEADDGKRFLADQRHEGLLVDYPVRFLTVPPTAYEEFLGLAMWAYAGGEFPCVQLVWPDKQGRWPWDAGVRDGFAAGQPILGCRPT
jgi:hypothetical protein